MLWALERGGSQGGLGESGWSGRASGGRLRRTHLGVVGVRDIDSEVCKHWECLTGADNVEFDGSPSSAHVKRTAQESFDPEAFVVGCLPLAVIDLC